MKHSTWVTVVSTFVAIECQASSKQGKTRIRRAFTVCLAVKCLSEVWKAQQNELNENVFIQEHTRTHIEQHVLNLHVWIKYVYCYAIVPECHCIT